jgi:hypothetical protein
MMRPKKANGSVGKEDSRGENKPSVGVGGDSTNRIPATSGTSWSGFVVIVSALGESKVDASGYGVLNVTVRSAEMSPWSTGESFWNLRKGKLEKAAGDSNERRPIIVEA